ncbi:uncharacterized protein BDZ99DRAFT_577459 [Mytilinidion resinicola]|uniref:Amidase signature enzyme n=1 Tax=Mytilinidion resinicola TaxID=574789 RepID=A0A6A6XZ27_9PEZI|nr:uncharacterized protein BDZ99DRAFT_577459 [Mytilinidion resinicola]KAF2801513.1 hypothetical protein BDZ99DRAFT_577459 [Mytilinidion resinicola]
MPEGSTPQKEVMRLVNGLASYLGVTANGISISTLWDAKPPDAALGEPLHEFLKEVGASTFLYENYQSAADFRDDYREKLNKNPSIGKTFTQAQFDESVRRMDVYKAWLLDAVLEMGKKHTVVVTQSEDVKSNYRDDPPPAYYIQPAWHQWWGSSVLGAPEVVIPAGQMPYKSRITGVTEHLPVMASLLTQPGSDTQLLELTHAFLEGVGRPTVVKSGSTMFKIEGKAEEVPANPWL